MGLFDSIEGNLDTIAAKASMTPEQVSKEATAAQHGLPVEQVQALVPIAG